VRERESVLISRSRDFTLLNGFRLLRFTTLMLALHRGVLETRYLSHHP
jgi:hypothetical protein